MSIRTSKNSKQTVLSQRSPVRTLLNSEFQAAMAWIARKKDKKTGNRIGKVSQIDDIIKYGKDTFSLYGRCGDKTISLNDVRGEAVFLRALPNGKIDTADIFVFCLGAGKYLICDWMKVWRTLDYLKGKGTTIYQDCWRLNKKNFIGFLETII